MAEAKLTLFDQSAQELAEFYKALAHPARVAILTFLAEKKTCYTGNIADELPLSRTTINQHLAELKRVGLIRGTVSGVKTNYCLDPKVISHLEDKSGRLFSKLIGSCSEEGGCC